MNFAEETISKIRIGTVDPFFWYRSMVIDNHYIFYNFSDF